MRVEDGDIIQRCPNCDDDMMFMIEDGTLRCANTNCSYSEDAAERIPSEKENNNG